MFIKVLLCDLVLLFFGILCIDSAAASTEKWEVFKLYPISKCIIFHVTESPVALGLLSASILPPCQFVSCRQIQQLIDCKIVQSCALIGVSRSISKSESWKCWNPMFPTHPKNGFQSLVTYKPKHDMWGIWWNLCPLTWTRTHYAWENVRPYSPMLYHKRPCMHLVTLCCQVRYTYNCLHLSEESFLHILEFYDSLSGLPAAWGHCYCLREEL